jgi:hypothetical protein
MIKKAIKKMPWVYEYAQHIHRRLLIRRNMKYKNMPFNKQLKLVEKCYQERIGHSLDWDNLRTYTEKMQYEKMFHKDDRKTFLSDKYLVREWIDKTIGSQYLIPLLGVWDNFDDIDFESLPNQFVLKTNNGSGTNVIIKDKTKIRIGSLRRLINDWLSTDFSCYNPFEWQYSAIKPKIIAEKYIESDNGSLTDYKFLCFNGEPKFVRVDIDRFTNHKRNVYNMNWELQNWNQYTYGNSITPIEEPQNFRKMVELASILSKGFSHVRVDLYDNKGIIYFGEMTFTNGSGFEIITPPESDLMLGDMWRLDTSECLTSPIEGE